MNTIDINFPNTSYILPVTKRNVPWLVGQLSELCAPIYLLQKQPFTFFPFCCSNRQLAIEKQGKPSITMGQHSLRKGQPPSARHSSKGPKTPPHTSHISPTLVWKSQPAVGWMDEQEYAWQDLTPMHHTGICRNSTNSRTCNCCILLPSTRGVLVMWKLSQKGLLLHMLIPKKFGNPFACFAWVLGGKCAVLYSMQCNDSSFQISFDKHYQPKNVKYHPAFTVLGLPSFRTDIHSPPSPVNTPGSNLFLKEILRYFFSRFPKVDFCALGIVRCYSFGGVPYSEYRTCTSTACSTGGSPAVFC